MITIAGLVLAALILVFFEVILPGGVLGLVALACVIGATLLSFNEYGLYGGLFTFLGTAVAIFVLVFVEFKLMANSKYGKGFFLKNAISGHSNVEPVKPDAGDLIGKTGLAITRLNPSGKVAIDDRTYEAHSQDGYIESGETVSVVAKDNFKLIIKKS